MRDGWVLRQRALQRLRRPRNAPARRRSERAKYAAATTTLVPERRTRKSVVPCACHWGLGLYIAAEVARVHGGTLTVESSAAETRFTFRMKAGVDTRRTGGRPRRRLCSRHN